MLSAAFSRCNTASCSSARPMPAFSLSSPSCSVTIPISANATNAIPVFPPSARRRDRRSSAASMPSTRPASRRARAPAGRTATGRPPLGRRAGPDTRRGLGTASGRHGGGCVSRTDRRGRRGCPRAHAGSPLSVSLRAARSRAEEARGLRAISSAEGTIARRVISAASGSRPQAHTGRSGGQMQPRARSDEEALDTPILERVERDSRRARHPCAAAPRRAGARGRAGQSSSLTAIRSAWKTRLAGWPAAEPGGRGNRGVDRVHELERRLDRRLCAPAHDRPRDRRPRIAPRRSSRSARARRRSSQVGDDLDARSAPALGPCACPAAPGRSRRNRARECPPASRTCPGRSRRCRRAALSARSCSSASA